MSKNRLTMLLLCFTLFGCKSAYDRENIFPFPASTTQEKNDFNSVNRGVNPMSRPSYNEYRRDIEDEKVSCSEITEELKSLKKEKYSDMASTAAVALMGSYAYAQEKKELNEKIKVLEMQLSECQ